MGGSPTVKLDFSSFQPLTKNAAQPGAYQQKPGGPILNANDANSTKSGLDFSTFVPLDNSGMERDPETGLSTIVPKEGESFSDTMNRAAAYGRTLSQDDINKQNRANLKRAPIALAAGPALAAAQLAAPVAASAAFAPTATTETVGTGVLDASGDEIMNEVAKYGPSVAKQTLTWVAKHPIASAAAYHAARELGIPLPKILDFFRFGGQQ